MNVEHSKSRNGVGIGTKIRNGWKSGGLIFRSLGQLKPILDGYNFTISQIQERLLTKLKQKDLLRS